MLHPAGLSLFLALPASPASLGPLAQEASSAPASRPLETRVTHAALFKNGFAFVRREGDVAAGTRELELAALPVPVHGTFWLVSDEGRSVERAVARRDEVSERAPARTVEELLRANVGRPVTLFVGDEVSLSGKLLAVAEPEDPWLDPDRGSTRPDLPGVPYAGANLVLLEGTAGTIALETSAVRRVVGADLAREFERSRAAVSLSVTVEPQGSEPGSLGVVYLERGLTWVPSYAIDLSRPGTARLTAKAEIIDEAEDLDGARVELVTGFPNLKFSQVADPIALQGSLDSFLSSLGASSFSAPDVAMQRVTLNVAAPTPRGGFPTAGAPGSGAAVGDLFFYELEDVTLARGERGLYPLFTVEVPYEHLYEWAIEDTIARGSASDAEEEIWHSVRLTNRSGLPWTTAPAMTMEQDRLLGQDILEYTAAGAQTTVRITRAVDVVGEQTEYEVVRDRNAASFLGRAYDRVTVRGELRATNHKDEAVQLEITKRISGEVSENPDGAEVVSTAQGLQEVNPHQLLTWLPTLPPGETVTIGYHYQLFVRP